MSAYSKSGKLIMNPLISIIVPIYKVPEQYLCECIESCINQTFQDIEIVLVDDGSPDECGKVCDKYFAKDERIKVIHKENGGLVSARNAGFEAMKGEWHMYLDGDDWIDVDCLSQTLDAAERYKNPDVVFWNIVQDLDGMLVYGKAKWTCEGEEKIYRGEDCKELARNTMIYSSGITPAYAKLINSRWAREFNIKHNPRLRQGEEGVEFSLRLFYYARTVIFLNKYYNHYRYNPSSISKSINEKNTKFMTDCFTVMEEDIEGFENRDEIKNMYHQRVVYGLIAMAMSTYFHPNNPDGLSLKVKKFKSVIASASLYQESIKKCPTIYMDKLRIIILYILKCRMFWMLAPIAQIKQFLLKRGYFNY